MLGKPGGACKESGDVVALKLCGIGGGAALCRSSGAAADSPLTIPCIRRFDC